MTITDGTTTLTETFDNTGVATFKGVTMTGNLTIASGTTSTSLNIPYFGNYTAVLSSFSASITVTYPNTASCTCTGNGESYTASGSPYTFTVHGVATYTITTTLDGVTKTDTVIITTDGQTESVTVEYGTINLTYADDFRGQTVNCVNGGTTITKTAPSSGNTMVFYPPTTGTWTISANVGGTSYSTDATITSLGIAISASLQAAIDITITIYSATEDTVTFTDAAGVAHSEVFATGQSSKSVTLKINPSGSSITFTSAIAKDPSALSSSYAKTIALTSATTDIYIMPDNALYWYGWIDSNFEEVNTTNGWAFTGGTVNTWITPTYNTNDIAISVSALRTFSGIGGKNAISGTAHLVGKAVNVDTYGIRFYDAATKTIPDYTAGETSLISDTSVAHYTRSVSAKYISVTSYAGGSTGHNRSGNIYALWYD